MDKWRVIKLGLRTQLFIARKRINEKDLEAMINILEDERKRRKIRRDDDLSIIKGV